MRNIVCLILLPLLTLGCTTAETKSTIPIYSTAKYPSKGAILVEKFPPPPNTRAQPPSYTNNDYTEKILGTWIENFIYTGEEEGLKVIVRVEGETSYLRNGMASFQGTHSTDYPEEPMANLVFNVISTQEWIIEDGILYAKAIDGKYIPDFEKSIIPERALSEREYLEKDFPRGAVSSAEIIKITDDKLILKREYLSITTTSVRKLHSRTTNKHEGLTKKSPKKDNYNQKILGTWIVNYSESFDDDYGDKMAIKMEGEGTYLRNGKGNFQGSMNLNYSDDPDIGTIVFDVWTTETWEIKDGILYETIIDSKTVANLEKSTNQEGALAFKNYIKEFIPKGLSSSLEIIKLNDDVCITKDEYDGTIITMVKKK